uniref:Uncharacterized protein n=1 Tax=Parascaris equorum TaxID=6256 RepID=A0A914R0V0_PAREQ
MFLHYDVFQRIGEGLKEGLQKSEEHGKIPIMDAYSPRVASVVPRVRCGGSFRPLLWNIPNGNASSNSPILEHIFNGHIQNDTFCCLNELNRVTETLFIGYGEEMYVCFRVCSHH